MLGPGRFERVALALVLVAASLCSAVASGPSPRSAISPAASASAQAAASPTQPGRSGGSIAFYSSRPGGGLYLVNRDGTGLRALPRKTNGGDYVWSPDGRTIAYADLAPGGQPPYTDIYTMNADGTRVTQLTHNADQMNQSPSWSHDGKRIAFVGLNQNIDAVYVMNADGSNVIRLTQDAYVFARPAWLPGDQGIAFVAYAAPVFVISAIDLDGSNQRQLFSDTKWHYFALVPSPDGRRFAVEEVEVNTPPALTSSPVVGGTQIAVLVPGQSPVQLTQQGGTHPRWSPDGKEIAFDTERDGPRRVYVMNADGSAQKALSTGGAPDQFESLADWVAAA
jgi:Tol biopolymer transport system component